MNSLLTLTSDDSRHSCRPFVTLLLLTALVGCGSKSAREGNTTRQSAVSAPGNGDQTFRSPGYFFEHTSVVIPPGTNSICPGGKFFLAEGDSHMVHRADLACI